MGSPATARSTADRDAEKVRSPRGPLADPEEQKRRRVGVQLWAASLRDARLLKLVRRGIDEPIGLLREVIREAQARGELARDLEPEAAARTIAALFHGIILQRAWDPRLDVAAHLAMIERVIDAAVVRLKPAQRRQRA